jgi:L,D-transpeptidase YcbB
MRWTSALIGAILLVAGFGVSRCGGGGDVIDTVAYPIATAVGRISVAEEYYNKKVQLKTELYYGAHEFRRAWLKKRRPEKIFKAFVDEVKESSQYGFNPRDYHIEELEKEVKTLYDSKKRSNADISDLDIRITASFFLFTTHLLEGRVRYPGAREFLWERGKPLENDIALLLKMESASDLRKELGDLHPKHPQYKLLQKAYKQYLEIQPLDTFAALPARLNVAPGQSQAAIPLVRSKISLNDGVAPRSDTSTLYDNALVEAVKKFQLRHGLDPDGNFDAKTIGFLNMSIKDKTSLIALNLERLRWLPHVQGKKDEIVINVPGYMMHVYQNNHEKMKMRVVLGSEYTPTPIFHDTLKYIVFSPTWIVPKSIIEGEFVPKLRENPAHFDPERFRFFKDGKEIDPLEVDWEDEDLEVSAYSVVENPGDANSLGSVKFIMPNDHSIYLHDTPADQLFGREERALSHGCIRLEDPVGFARYLLSDQQGWNEEKIKESMTSKEPLKVDLKKPYPVYIVYRTTWVDDDKLVHFHEDIYGHDRRHLAYLE